MYRYMYVTLFCDIVFRMYLVYFKIWCSDQILLVLCPGNMSEDVIKRVRNHSSHIWVWPHSYNLQQYNFKWWFDFVGIKVGHFCSYTKKIWLDFGLTNWNTLVILDDIKFLSMVEKTFCSSGSFVILKYKITWYQAWKTWTT